MRLALTALLPAAFAVPLTAQELQDLSTPPPMVHEEAPAAAPALPVLGEEDGLEPEVTIIQRREERIEEYRMGGRLYMVKVTPRRGPAYYLVDTTGDGELDSRRNELDPNIMVPSWILFQW